MKQIYQFTYDGHPVYVDLDAVQAVHSHTIIQLKGVAVSVDEGPHEVYEIWSAYLNREVKTDREPGELKEGDRVTFLATGRQGTLLEVWGDDGVVVFDNGGPGSVSLDSLELLTGDGS